MLIYVFYGCSFDCKAQKLRSVHSLHNVMAPRHPKHNLEKHWGAMLQFKCAACALKLSLCMENRRTPTLEEVDNQRLLVVWVSTLLGATRLTICEDRTFWGRFYDGWDRRSSYSVVRLLRLVPAVCRRFTISSAADYCVEFYRILVNFKICICTQPVKTYHTFSCNVFFFYLENFLHCRYCWYWRHKYMSKIRCVHT